MIAAMNLRLPSDAVCDMQYVYLDGIPIAARPYDLDDASWRQVCRRLCGYSPIKHVLEPEPVVENDPEVWKRLDTYMAGIERSQRSASRSDPSLRRR